MKHFIVHRSNFIISFIPYPLSLILHPLKQWYLILINCAIIFVQG
jgi:hypothetical protein